jgi:hypothetical protein
MKEIKKILVNAPNAKTNSVNTIKVIILIALDNLVELPRRYLL